MLNGATVVVFEGVIHLDICRCLETWDFLSINFLNQKFNSSFYCHTNTFFFLHSYQYFKLMNVCQMSYIFHLCHLDWTDGCDIIICFLKQTPNYPDSGRCWEIVDKYKISIFYTAPTLVRSLMRDDDKVRFMQPDEKLISIVFMLQKYLLVFCFQHYFDCYSLWQIILANRYEYLEVWVSPSIRVHGGLEL